MPDAGPQPQLSVKLKGILDHTASWARVLADGRIELEYYDFSPDAQEWFGNDVAWTYRIEASEKPRLYALLAVTDDRAMLDAIAATFGDAKAVRDWLQENGVPYIEEFDSWA